VAPAATDAPAARILAEAVARMRWADLAEPVRMRTRELLLDHLAVTAGGSDVASSRAARSFVAATSSTGAATVIGGGFSTAAAWAALANGTSSHALELDDVTRRSALHPGAPVIPAALAVGEEVGAGAADVLDAIVAGYEVVMRAGAALNGASAYRRGFHPTGVAGVFGATVAAGRLIGLDADGLTRAMGIAGGMASGSLEYLADGSWTKRLTPGWAAHGGVVAAGLARAGYVGPASALDGKLGFLHAYSDDPDPSLLTRDLGSEPMLMQVAIKPYGCCRWIHGLIDCAFALAAEHRFSAADVKAIDLGVLSSGSLLIAEPIERKRHPKSVVEAQFSAPFGVAVALVRGKAGASQFSAANMADPDIQWLMERTSCYRDPALDAGFPDRIPSEVRIRLRDGRELKATVDFPKGEPEHWLTRDELVERFVELAGPLVGADVASSLAEGVLALDAGSDLAPIMRALSGTRDTA